VSILGIILVSESLNEDYEQAGYEAEVVSDAPRQQPAETTSQAPVQMAKVDSAALLGTLDFLYKGEPESVNHILELYRKDEAKECVIAFFAGVCHSKDLAEIILHNADLFDISPALAFALSWEESKFNPRAVNNANRNGSVDRGLFQLNNRSFPHLETLDFFNPQVNAYNAMKYLRSCIKTGGNEIGALAVYNAGIGRVNRTGAPWVTIDYISRIEENVDRIETHFIEWEDYFLKPPVQPEVITVEVIKEVHDNRHLSLIPKLFSGHIRH
jgi:hypothetical protein